MPAIALTRPVSREILLADQIAGDANPRPGLARLFAGVVKHEITMKARSALVCLGIVCLTLTAWGQKNGAASGTRPSSSATPTQQAAGQQAPVPAAATPKNASQAPPTQAKPAHVTAPAQQGQIKQPTPAASPTAPVTASVPAARSPVPPPDGGQFLVRLRDLQARVDELKEQIRRSHARLSLLSDTILTSGVNAARVEIKFQNEMSAAFRVTRVLVLLDGTVQYNKADEGETLSTQRQIPVFTGTIAPGDHTLQVSVKLRGHGYGVFSYLRGFTFDLKDELKFSVDEGKTIQIAAMAWEKGGATTALEERPALRFTSKSPNGGEPDAKQGKGSANKTGPASSQAGPGDR
jgi:hypothetical protein